MLLKLIACNVFMREACLGIAHSPHVIDVEFLELGEHVRSDRLRQALQAKIDRAEAAAKKYDAILLLYGLCGNAAVGLRVRKTRLVMPRAHDCCTILLGSKQRFQENFEQDPSTPFSSIGYLERGEYFIRTDTGDGQIEYGDQYAALVEQYGEDNAKYIWENMHPESSEAGNKRVVFIDIPETSSLGGEQRFREKAEKEDRQIERLDGDLTLIRRLLHGDWNTEDFLIVEPGQQTAGVYDWTEIVRATPTSTPAK
jgi:hypothetical protein